jgi:hypothetical protein
MSSDKDKSNPQKPKSNEPTQPTNLKVDRPNTNRPRDPKLTSLVEKKLDPNTEKR